MLEVKCYNSRSLKWKQDVPGKSFFEHDSKSLYESMKVVMSRAYQMTSLSDFLFYLQ